MPKTLLLLFLVFYFTGSFAQAPPPGAFGGFEGYNFPDQNEEITPEYRARIQNEIRTNIAILERKGILASNTLKRPGIDGVKFSLPLRQADGYNDPGFYGISNYVDVDQKGSPKDYNCGTRTYYAHMGTDFFTTPLWWEKMDNNAVEVIAGADGIIVYKEDGKDDRNCANCTTSSPASCWDWNAIYLQQADGTVAFYGHMKKNSLTTKGVGDAVTKGEFLGVVGSSGNSSGPHLHFELWRDTKYDFLYIPWEGPCNPDENESMWENQEPYYNPQVLKIISTQTNPSSWWKTCYNGAPEQYTAKTTFIKGSETVNLNIFVRDNVPGGPGYRMKLINPDGVAIYDWTLIAFNTYWATGSYYYTFSWATFEKAGMWKFEVTYGDSYAEHEFYIRDLLPLNLVSFKAKKNNDVIQLDWITESEQQSSHFEIERSEDGTNFSKIGSVPSTGNSNNTQNSYTFNDANPLAGTQFYRLKMMDADGNYKFSEIVKVDFGYNLKVKMFPNPATNFVDLKNTMGFNRLTITNINGQAVISEPVSGNETRIDISRLNKGVYIVQLSGNGKGEKLKLIKD